MGSIGDIKKRFEALQGNEAKLAIESLEEHKDFAMDLVAGQLAKGIKSDGTKSDFTYTPFTIASKKQKSGLASVTSHLTNYGTGESYDKMFMAIKGDDIEFGTKTYKEASISERMDGLAFKPTKDNREDLIREKVNPTFWGKIKAFLSRK